MYLRGVVEPDALWGAWLGIVNDVLVELLA